MPTSLAAAVARVAVVAALALPLVPPAAAAQRAELLVTVEELEARAVRDSLDPMAHYEAALGYWKHRRWDDAERALRRAVEIEPKTAAAYLALSHLPYARWPKLAGDERKGKLTPEQRAMVEESDRLYRRAFIIDPMVDLKIYGLMIPPAEAVVGSSKRAQSAYAEITKGFIYFWDGRYAAAFKWFDDIINYYKPKQQDELPSFLFWYRGLAAARIERYDVAAADVRRLLDRALAAERGDSTLVRDPLRANEYRYLLATVYRLASRYDDAIALYEESLANDLGLYMAHTQLATLHEERRAWPKAILERRRALEAHPEDPSLLYDLGVTLARARLYGEAATTLQRAMAANPLNARIPYMLGSVYLRLGDGPAAKETLGRFLAMAPSRFADQATEVRAELAKLP